MELTLKRLIETKNTTIGQVFGLDVQIFSLEDAWKSNQRNISRIPAGRYKCVPHGWKNELVKFPRVWRLEDVPGRDAILIHVGNSHHDTQGCILLGLGLSIDADAFITNSRKAVDMLRGAIGPHEFWLTVVDA